MDFTDMLNEKPDIKKKHILYHFIYEVWNRQNESM